MIINLDEIDSTNEYLKRMSDDGYNSDELLVATAQYQTSGKGRRGRSWVTEPGTALMFSVLLKPRLKLDDCSMLTLVMALAVKRSLSDMDIEAMIKWPNDLVLNKKKICGILTEAIAETGQMIIGVGINTNQESMPDDLSLTATSILMETDDCIDHDSLLNSIIYNFEQLTESVYDTGDLSLLRKEYEDSLVSMNKTVTVLDPSNEYDGICKGIDDRGQLIVEHENKETRVYAGEVSVRGIYGYV
ncbi:MAG: biotin--[acetyl-CoA-carboxylase] ligase [Lachnospiraceae bacterium]|nr:biotin--[acetyl-CoA-carboxylase] ligase [Lachnospiraceae bacterium]